MGFTGEGERERVTRAREVFSSLGLSGSLERFVAEGFRKRSLLGSRCPHAWAHFVPPRRLSDALSLAPLDLLGGDLALAHAGRAFPWDHCPLPGASLTHVRAGDSPCVRSAFEAGFSVIARLDPRLLRDLAPLTGAFEQLFGVPTYTALYISPAGHQGFPVHHDQGDVFVFQLGGSKRWQVYRPSTVDPQRGETYDSPDVDRLAPERVATLRPGDCLYVPAGFPHAAVCEEEVSVHMTLSLEAPRVVDVMRASLRAMAAQGELGLQQVLECGWYDDLNDAPVPLNDVVRSLVQQLPEAVGDRAMPHTRERASDVRWLETVLEAGRACQTETQA